MLENSFRGKSEKRETTEKKENKLEWWCCLTKAHDENPAGTTGRLKRKREVLKRKTRYRER